MTAWEFLDHPGPIPFAHRGGAREFPENTMAAFEGAMRLGYRYLETDVHATTDGVALAFHDHVLDRVTDRAGVVCDLPWSDVRNAKVGGTEPIVLLEDLLGAFPDARVNLDPKHDGAVEPLAAVLRRTGAVERVCVGAFSDRRIARLRRLVGEGLCTALGPRGIAGLRTASLGAPLRRFAAACAQVPVRHGRLRIVDDRFVRCAHRLGLQVHVWTIDDATEMSRLLDLGVDGIMTDRPSVLKDVLAGRGQWVD